MAGDPLHAKCRRDFHAAHESGPRNPHSCKWVVMHAEEAGTAVSAASWFQNPKSAGSTQLAVDDDVCYRPLGDDRIPWGAHGANTLGLHIEQAGFSAWPRLKWLVARTVPGSKPHRQLRRTVERAAVKAARYCHTYGIPATFLSAGDLRAGRSGITTHRNVERAWPFSGHTDPGLGWPRRRFMRRVRHELAALRAS